MRRIVFVAVVVFVDGRNHFFFHRSRSQSSLHFIRSSAVPWREENMDNSAAPESGPREPCG